jgi:sugar phosphate isomerase/epimerase
MLHRASISRRQFLSSSAAFAGGVLLAGRPVLAQADPYGGFKVGLQSYTLRAFDAKTALEHTKRLGVKFWESFPKHVPLSTLPAAVGESKKLLGDAGVKLVSYGVVRFNSDETEARKIFDFAKAMGIVSLSADPDPDRATFDLLDKLVQEYDVAIAIHNHGPGHRYDKADDVLKWVKDRHVKVGACVDTGHYLRSNENPVEVIQKFGNRVHGVHLKDVRTVKSPEEQDKIAPTLTKNRQGMLKKENKMFTVLGEGELDTVGVLKALKKLNYQNCVALEYEESEQNPLGDVELCLAAVRDAVKKV